MKKGKILSLLAACCMVLTSNPVIAAELESTGTEDTAVIEETSAAVDEAQSTECTGISMTVEEEQDTEIEDDAETSAPAEICEETPDQAENLDEIDAEIYNDSSDAEDVSQLSLENGEPIEVATLSSGVYATVGDYTYYIDNGVASIYKYSSTARATSVTVQTSFTYDGASYVARTIMANAFEGNPYIQTLVLPKVITSVGNCAFKNCTGLSSITINGNLNDCDSYSVYTTSYSGRYSVFWNAGANAESLTVTFGSGVTRIPNYLFATEEGVSAEYAHVTKVVCSSTVTEIGNYAFYHCADLTAINFNTGVKTIGSNAFAQCTSLPKVTLGAGVQTLNDYAFANDTCLTSLTLNTALLTIGSHAFYNDISLRTLTGSSKLTTINSYAFENCSSLTTVTLQKSTETLNRGAFKNCTALTSLTINGNIKDCDSYSVYTTSYSSNYSAFYNAGAYAESFTVTFGDTVTSVGAYLFATEEGVASEVAHVTKVVFSSGVKTVGAYAFYNCTDLTSISWGGVETIGNYSFAYCKALPKVSFGSSVKSTGSFAFAYDTNVASLTLDSALVSLGDHTFIGNTSLKTLNGSENLTTIGSYAFENCSALTTVTLQKATTSLKPGAFKNCVALNTVKIYGDIQDCDSYSVYTTSYSSNYSVFYNAGANASSMTVIFCTGVTRVPAYLLATHADVADACCHATEVRIPSTVTSIGSYAFYNCDNLKTLNAYTGDITLGNNVLGAIPASMTTVNCYYNTTVSKYVLDNGNNVVYYSPVKPTITAITNTSDGIRINWSESKGAEKYQIYRSVNGGSYSKINSITGKNYTDRKATTEGAKYSYKIIPICYQTDGTLKTGTASAVNTMYRLNAVTISSAVNTADGTKITWKKNSSATGYTIYRQNGTGTMSVIKTISSNDTVSYSDAVASKNGVKYTYKVVPFKTVNNVKYNGTESAVKVIYRLSKPAISSLTNSSAGSLKATWDRNTSASGYQIQYSKSSSFSSATTVKISGNSTVTKTITGLTKGSTYYVKVRSYKVVNGTYYYSSWSSSSNLKLTK